jgi:myo-inositol-1(or 4)-monophosphatase
VSLGLVAGDRSILGVIEMPFLGKRYAAADGLGATCNGQPIHGSTCSSLSDALIAIGDYAVGTSASDRNRVRLALTTLLAANVQRVRMLGTAATDLAWVAEGNLDASVMFTNKPWDTSAGVLIAREAGVQVLDVDGSQHTFNSTGTVAVAAPLAAELLSLIQEAQSATAPH